MNYMIGFAIALVCMLIGVFAYMLVVARKLQDVLDELDVIKFGVKDVIKSDTEALKDVFSEIHNLCNVCDRLINIEKDFDNSIAESTNNLVEVCKTHLCAIEDRCKRTEQMVANCTASIAGTAEAVKSLRESTDALEDQVTAITDYIRGKSVEKEPSFDQEPLCKSCKYEKNTGSPCITCSETATCNYEPKNAFEQAGAPDIF